jgi:hypothetical protein
MPTIEEKELEDFLMEPGNLQHLELYTDLAYTTRQLNLGPYGIADIVQIQPVVRKTAGYDFLITVVELKKDEVNVSTLTQACRYVAALKQFIRTLSKAKPVYIESMVVLVGRTINTNDWTHLGHHLNNVRVWTYNLDLETGISFDPHCLEDYEIVGAKAPASFAGLFTDLIEPKKIKLEREYKASLEPEVLCAPAPELLEAPSVHV